MTKEEIIATIKECALRLGEVPSMAKLEKATHLSRHDIEKFFGRYSHALDACGLERRGSGYRMSARALFLEWAAMVRKLGKVPSSIEWALNSKSAVRTLTSRFGRWHNVAAGMLDYARREKLEEWKDVEEIVICHLHLTEGKVVNSCRTLMNSSPRILSGRRMYGAPFALSTLAHEPINESGVLFAFGMVAHLFGLAITNIQTEFPDCEAMREVTPGRWQRILIELEYESSNFLAHMHPTNGCDMIVCWRHNWPECPLEVIELSKVFSQPELFPADRRK